MRAHEAMRAEVIATGAFDVLSDEFSVAIKHDDGPGGTGVLLDLERDGEDAGYLAVLPGPPSDPEWYAAAGVYDDDEGHYAVFKLGEEPDWGDDIPVMIVVVDHNRLHRRHPSYVCSVAQIGDGVKHQIVGVT